jgi:hypothetical protein
MILNQEWNINFEGWNLNLKIKIENENLLGVGNKNLIGLKFIE